MIAGELPVYPIRYLATLLPNPRFADMRFLLTAALLSGLSIAAAAGAHAQTSGPAFPMPGQSSSEAGARRTTAEDPARSQRRATMKPDEAKRDQQLELLEARTGNTSFGRGAGPERQFDGNRKGGFMVRKFKARPGFGQQKRGMSHPMGSSNPAGKPLVHKHKNARKKFLLF